MELLFKPVFDADLAHAIEIAGTRPEGEAIERMDDAGAVVHRAR